MHTLRCYVTEHIAYRVYRLTNGKPHSEEANSISSMGHSKPDTYEGLVPGTCVLTLLCRLLRYFVNIWHSLLYLWHVDYLSLVYVP